MPLPSRKLISVFDADPELAARLGAGIVDAARAQALVRVVARLMLLLWALADRWGTVGPDGVAVPLKLTHKVLGRVIRAQRPSVTAAIRELQRRGMLSPRKEGGWLLHGEVETHLELLENG